MDTYILAVASEPATSSHPEEWGYSEAISNLSNYMTIVGGMGLTFIAFLFFIGGLGSLFKSATINPHSDRGTFLFQAFVRLILGSLLGFGGITLIRSSQNSTQDQSTDTATSTPEPTTEPNPSPTPSPEPNPTPAPESHDAPSITIDSTAAIIIAATVAVVLLIIVLVIVHKKRAQRKAEKQQERDYRAMVKRDFDYAQARINKISAAYAQAHVDPEYVLYKPLVISNAPLAYEFSSQLMDARSTLEECDKALQQDTKSDIDFVAKSKLRKLADSLNRAWDNLNRKAEEVGTPLLDAGQLRRAESLWSLATNESATVHERQRAMDKLQEIIAECQEDLNNHADTTQHSDNTQEMLTAIFAVVNNGSRRGIIAPPQRVVELMPSTTPALTA